MFDEISLADAVEFVVDNRGKTVPVQETGFPLIATNCVSNENLYPEFNNVRYVSDEIHENWFRAHPLPGDILLTNKGSKNGAICLVPDPVSFCIAQDMVALRAKDGLVYPKYLFAVLRSKLVQNRIKELNVDSVIPHFKKTDFDKLFFPLPDYKKQMVIGDSYFNYCNKIELNRQTNQTLEQIAQAIFKSWFVDFEPVKAKIAAKQNNQDPELAAMFAISGKTEVQLKDLDEAALRQLKTTAALFPDALVESELSEIPEGWNSGTLDDLCHLNKSSWIKKNAPQEVWYVDLANTKNGVIEELQYYSWNEAPSRARRILNEGDTIVGTVRPGNRSYSLIGATHKQLTASTGFAVLTPKETNRLEFIFIAATSDENINRLAHLADGAAYPAVRPDVVTQMLLTLPSEAVMSEFSKIVKPLFQQRNCNIMAEVDFRSLRDVLLPKLLSGELDVIEAA